MKLLALAGILLLVISIGCFVYILPRKGKVHPWAVLPVIESVIPLAIITGAVFGVAAIVAAFM
jgi:hypothetical protein